MSGELVILKIYNLSILIEPKAGSRQPEIISEILQQIEKDGQETIVCPVNGKVRHEALKHTELTVFPDCLTYGTNRLALAIALPTRKDLGRRWFLKRLAGENKSSYQLIATTDVSVIHIETD